MKKRLLYSILCALLIILSTRIAISQRIETDSILSSKDFFSSNDFVNLSRGDTIDITIIVEEGTLKLTLQMGSIINFGGGVSFGIFDPNNKKQEGLALMNYAKGEKIAVVSDILRDKDYVTSNKKLLSKESFERMESSSTLEGYFLREFTNPLPGKWIITVAPTNIIEGKFKINHLIVMK